MILCECIFILYKVRILAVHANVNQYTSHAKNTKTPANALSAKPDLPVPESTFGCESVGVCIVGILLVGLLLVGTALLPLTGLGVGAAAVGGLGTVDVGGSVIASGGVLTTSPKLGVIVDGRMVELELGTRVGSKVGDATGSVVGAVVVDDDEKPVSRT
jgi:hypothetical protein